MTHWNVSNPSQRFETHNGARLFIKNERKKGIYNYYVDCLGREILRGVTMTRLKN